MSLHITTNGVRHVRTTDYADAIVHILGDKDVKFDVTGDRLGGAMLYTAAWLCSSKDGAFLPNDDRKIAKFIVKNARRIHDCIDLALQNCSPDHRWLASRAIEYLNSMEKLAEQEAM